MHCDNFNFTFKDLTKYNCHLCYFSCSNSSQILLKHNFLQRVIQFFNNSCFLLVADLVSFSMRTIVFPGDHIRRAKVNDFRTSPILCSFLLRYMKTTHLG